MVEALYRKYRPQVFEDVVGQDHIERTLKNAIDQDQVSHAYLFCGPRGTGKTTSARLLAKALLCEHGPTSAPDGTCRECIDIANGVHPDVYELDAASRTGVENVREEIIGRVNFAPTRGKVKVYIIDEVHMLSTAAFNALLKTLEEPPDHVIFILCTTDPQKVPETIQSRCQRFDFHRLSNDEIVARLGAICVAEGVEFEGDALDLIAHRAEGGMRNALTSLEQLIAFGEGSVTVKGAEDLLGSLNVSDMAEIITAIGRRDIAACFTWTAGYVETGADLAQFARDMAEHVRNMYVLSLAGSDAALDVPDAVRRELTDEMSLFGFDRLARLLGVLGDLISDLRTATNPRLCFEIALTRMVRPDSDLTLESLAERVEALELGQSAVSMQVASGAPTTAAPAVRSGANQSESPVPVQKTQCQPERSVPSSTLGAEQVHQAATRKGHTTVTDKHAPQAVSQSQCAQDVVSVQTAPAVTELAGSLADTLANPAALQRLWRSVVTAAKKEKVSYGVLLVNVKIRPDANGTGITVEFPADNPFAYAMACKSENRAVLDRAFVQVTGAAVPFVCVQATGKVPASGPSNLTEAAVDDSRVPLEAYGAIAADHADEGKGAVFGSVPTSSIPSHAAATQLSSSQPDVRPASEARLDASSAPSADDMSRLLSDTMGSDIEFEEIDE